MRIEWLVKRQDTMTLEAVDPFGGTIVGLDLSEGVAGLRIYGPQARKLHPLDVVEDGKVQWDGHFTGFRYQELGCLLSGRFPARWLLGLRRIDSSREQAVIRLRDAGRSIVVRGRRAGSGTELCAQIEWSTFLGFFSQRVECCLYEAPQKRIEVTLENGMTMLLSPADA